MLVDVKLVVVADTHGPKQWRGIPEGILPDLRTADAILHAGDVCVPSVLDELAAFAPVHVVMGNNDGPDVAAWGAVDVLEEEFAGARIAMLHISGPKDGRNARLRQQFPDADVVVFGHSHLPWNEEFEGARMFNPGSLTHPRSHPWPSYGVLDIADGRVTARIVQLPRPPRRTRSPRVTP